MPMPGHSGDASAADDAKGEVSAVLLNLEHTIPRAKEGLVKIRKAGGDTNVELALAALVKDLEEKHRRLMQAACYATNPVCLI